MNEILERVLFSVGFCLMGFSIGYYFGWPGIIFLAGLLLLSRVVYE